MAKSVKPVVVQQEGKEIAPKILAHHIAEVAKGMREALAAGLSEKAIIVLIQNAIPSGSGTSNYGQRMPQKDIKAVLLACANLDKEYLSNWKVGKR